MDAKRKNICRLCLTNDRRCRYEQIDNTTRVALDALLMDMNLDVCRNAVICSECAATVSRCLRFKLQCVRKEQQLLSSTVENAVANVCLEDMLESSKRYADNLDGVCEFCIDPAKTHMPNIDTLEPSVGKILPIFFPEKKFCSIQNFTTCSSCATELEVYFIFLNKCMKTEGNVNVYLHQNDGTIPIDLSDVYDARKYFDRDIKKHDKVKKYKCSNCAYEAKWKHYLNTNVKMKHDPTCQVQKYKCSNCTFETKWKGNLKIHMKMHLIDLGVVNYECSDCTFETNWKRYLKGLRHTDLVARKYKCSNCAYETTRRAYLNTHMEICHNDCEMKKYKCSNCTYETNWKNCLITHMNMKHNPTFEVKKYKCSDCTFETKWKGNLKDHIATQHGSCESKKYKCSSCTYETNRTSHINTHIKMQHNPDKVVKYKCSSCSFETKWKNHIKTHMKMQHNADRVENYKCPSCSYETKWKSHLNSHMEKQHSADQVVKYECSSCSYETKWKENLKRHMATRHKTRETDN